MRGLYLVLAILWFGAAAVLFGWERAFPDRPAPRLGTTGLSLGWFGIVLGVYNVVRCWLRRGK